MLSLGRDPVADDFCDWFELWRFLLLDFRQRILSAASGIIQET